MQAKARWVSLFGSLVLASCGHELSGAYADDTGVTNYTFIDDGTVKISVLGNESVAEYRLDGNKILVSSAQGTVVLTQRDDHLYGPMGLDLKRQDRKSQENSNGTSQDFRSGQ